MKNQNQWFFSPDLAFLASLSSVFNSWKKKKKMQRQINHRYCKKFKKPSLKNPLIKKKKMWMHEKKTNS